MVRKDPTGEGVSFAPKETLQRKITIAANQIAEA